MPSIDTPKCNDITVDYGKSLLGNKEVQDALNNINKLTNEEGLMRIAEIQGTVTQIYTIHSKCLLVLLNI